MLTGIRAALKARLDAIASFETRVLDVPPAGQPDTPYAFVGDPIKYRGHNPLTYGEPAFEAATIYLPVVVVCGGETLRDARLTLDDYLLPAGLNSVTTALRLDSRTDPAADSTLDGTCDSAVCLGIEDFAQVGATSFGALWVLELVVATL